MSHRQKGHHKPRHHTHPIKAASLYKPGKLPEVPEVSGVTPPPAPSPEPPVEQEREQVVSEE